MRATRAPRGRWFAVWGTALSVGLVAGAAEASPLFELAGGSIGTGGLSARVAGESSASTYFNPALLPYAEQSFETATMILSDRISLTLDGRPSSADVPLGVGNRTYVGPDGNPISNATVPTSWLQNGCTGSQCGASRFAPRPRQSDGSSGKTRAYQVVGLVNQIIPKRLVLGLHVIVPLGKFTTAGSFYNDEREQFFSNSLHPELYSDRLTATSVAFGIGSEIVKNLSIGLSFTLNLVNTAQAGTYVRDPGDYDKLLLDTNVGVQAAVAHHVGVAWRPIDSLRLAATAHQEQKFEIDTGLTAALPSGTESGTSRTQVHDFLPWMIGLGGTFDVARQGPHKVGVVASGTYGMWSRYLDRHGQSPRDYGSQYAWKNTVSPTIGVRHSVGGFRDFLDVTYVPSPVPSQVGRSNYVDSDRVGLAIGGDYTFTWVGVKWRPGVMLQGHRVLPRYQKKDDSQIIDELPDGSTDAQTKLPATGAAGLQTNNPGWPGFASQGWVYGGAVSVSVLY